MMKYFSYSHFFTWRHWFLVYTIVAIISAAPLILVIFGSLLGHALGCGALGESSVPDCPGGSVIYVLFVSGWFGLITFPFGAFIMIFLALANVPWYFTRKSGENP